MCVWCVCVFANVFVSVYFYMCMCRCLKVLLFIFRIFCCFLLQEIETTIPNCANRISRSKNGT